MPFVLTLHVLVAWAFSLIFTLTRRRGDYSVQNTFANETYYTQYNPDHFNLLNRVISFAFEHGGFTPPVFYAANIMAGVGLLVLFHSFVRRTTGVSWAGWLVLALALSPEFIYYHNFVLKETLTVILTATALMALAVAVTERRVEYYLLAVVLGVVAVVNREFLVLFFLLLPLLFFRGWRAWALVAVTVTGVTIAVGFGLYQAFLEGAQLRAEQVLFGAWGNQRIIREAFMGLPTPVPYLSLFQDPTLLRTYLFHSVRLFLTPGMAGGNAINFLVVPAQVALVGLWLCSISWARNLPPSERTLWRYILMGTVVCAVGLILLDSGERYRYTLLHGPVLVLIVLGIRGRQKGRPASPSPPVAPVLSLGNSVQWIRRVPLRALTILVVPMAVAAVMAASAAPRFEARTQLAPVSPSTPATMELPSFEGPWAQPQPALWVEVARSRPVLARLMGLEVPSSAVAGKALAFQLPVHLGDLYPPVHSGPGYDFDQIRADLQLRPDASTNLIDVAYSQEYPKIASMAVTHLLEIVEVALHELRVQGASEEQQWVEARERELRSRIRDLELRMGALMRANRTIPYLSPVGVEVGRLQFERELVEQAAAALESRRHGLEADLMKVPGPFVAVGEVWVTQDLSLSAARLWVILALVTALGCILILGQVATLRGENEGTMCSG
ncbi:MAG: hypothetical protein WEA09_03950 [Gemmatimonadota bacterium]